MHLLGAHRPYRPFRPPLINESSYKTHLIVSISSSETFSIVLPPFIKHEAQNPQPSISGCIRQGPVKKGPQEKEHREVVTKMLNEVKGMVQQMSQWASTWGRRNKEHSPRAKAVQGTVIIEGTGK